MNKPCGTSNKPPCARGPWIGLAALAAFAISGLTFAQTKLYVVNAGSDDVSVIDTKSGAVSKTIKGPGHLTPIAYNAAKGLLYLPTQESPGHVHFIDPNTDTFGETWMEVGNGPIYMLVSSEFDRAYVSNFFGGVSVLDTTSESQVTEITTLVSPVGAAMEPTASKMYVINSATSEISVIDANTNSPIRNIPLGCFNPLDIKLDVVLHKAFAAKNSCSELAVLETAGDSLLTTIKLPGRPQYIVIDSQTHRGYVTYNSGLGESGAKGG